MKESSQEPGNAEFEAEPAEDLSRSYSALLDQQSWEVDVGEPAEDMPTASAAKPAPAAPPPLERIVEALLFIGGAPLTPARACETIRGLAAAQFMQAIDALNRAYRRQGRPYTIQAQGQGYILSLRRDFIGRISVNRDPNLPWRRPKVCHNRQASHAPVHLQVD